MDKANLILNSTIELIDIQEEGNGKGRPFVSRFLEPGIAHYKELGDILITKETLNKFIHTMVGCPVIIEHEDVTDKNADKLRVGVVSRVWFNEMDGYFYCEGILTDPEAIDLVKNQGYNVSCAYSFVSDNTKKTHNGKEIDMEFIDGEFLHLALVKDPRYEGANIVVNKNDDDLEWITVKGNHIPVKKGQSKDEAVKEFLEGKQSGTKDKSGDSKEKDDYKREADIALTMMAQDYEKKGNKGTVDRANELKEKLKKSKELTDKDKADIKIALEYYKDGGAEGVEEKRKKDQEKYEKEKEYYNKKQEEKLVEFKKEYPIGTKFIEKYFGQDREHSIQGIKLDDVDKAIIITDENGKEHHALARDITLTKEKSDLKKDKNIERNKSLLKTDLTHMLKDIDRSADYRFEDSTQRLQVNDFGLWEKNEDGELRPTKETKQKVEQIKDSFKKRFNLDLDITWSEKKLYTFSIKNKANNSIGDVTMTVLNDLTDFIKKVVKNEKDEEMKKVKNEDKRKLIDEVGGILKGKVDDEIIRTVIKKMEEASYEPSEDNKADNEDDEEKEAKNKCKNEEDEKEEKIEEKEKKVTENEDEDKKEEDKKEVKNSMKDIVMGGNTQVQEHKLYTSRKERLEEGNKY